MEYCKRLRDLRIDNDLRQEDVAKILKTSKQTYGRYENGTRKLSIEDLKTLCEFYNVSADYIIGITDKQKPITNIRNNVIIKNNKKINKIEIK